MMLTVVVVAVYTAFHRLGHRLTMSFTMVTPSPSSLDMNVAHNDICQANRQQRMKCDGIM